MSRKLTEEELKLLAESGYSKKAIGLYANSVNVGAMENPNVVTTYRGPCGDVIKLYLKIDRTSIIQDAKFYYAGCPGVATSSSAMIELVKGKTVGKAKKMTEDDVLKELGGLPKTKLDCPKLAITTLRKAIAEYEKTKGAFRNITECIETAISPQCAKCSEVYCRNMSLEETNKNSARGGE